MQIAPKTGDEVARLQALYDYDILDTEAEKVFDDLTLLASQICDKPITLISLVDPERQWFKSTVGIDATETSRDIAFCAHAIHQKDIFEVEDTLLDERFFDNPLVTSAPNIRFYAGTQLQTASGHAIGTLCVIDEKPSKLTEQQKQSLEILGRAVISQMELRKKIKDLKVATEHKTDFMSNMSHELRTPLNAIINFSQLLLDQVEQHPDPKLTEYLENIDYSGKRLLSVVNSVLDINKIEAGKMPITLKPVDFADLIHHLERMLNIGAKNKQVKFSVSINKNVPEELVIDEALISQIVTNLVHNAIKFTTSGNTVNADFSYENQRLIISIIDQGVGISEQDQEKLFNKFQQVGNTNNQQGSGLGLSIVQKLVTLLDGTIEVKSQLNKGSQFIVTLPMKTKNKSISKIENTEAPAQMFNLQAKVLLVEDNEINQAVMAAIFESLNLPVILAESGEIAVEKNQQTDFDLVFMDIHLPGIDGREATKIIKQTHPNLMIVALTADTFAQERDDNNTAIWHDYLTKPLEKNKLIEVLNRYIPQ
ncbi:ATP-binding protein [Paraglaciecola aquimarina]|uniref:histidine kinase n=1 Tax=Paraglaciecola algarum TaxID=3050085 RepID=A0ABS9D8S1_9ALTE|nr:GAF domain-containing hybrid sensor histidine kinase/response regulator [Paraglaciecola sp. G1-23]MCF2948398.1 ATP-binding protein [Paraglaciecola sp. G1-23]